MFATLRVMLTLHVPTIYLVNIMDSQPFQIQPATALVLYKIVHYQLQMLQEAKSDYLGQLIVTPEMVAKKIKAMKDNKSPGVDGIPPKLILETVEQISIPLARVFNLSLKEGVVPFEWKEANIIPLFKKGSRNK